VTSPSVPTGGVDTDVASLDVTGTDATGNGLAIEHAAGVVCWRDATGQPRGLAADPERAVEVLLVHRPRYDDWSFPKGKVEPGESLPECAVRETAEETGVRVRLGRPLPTVHYSLPDGRPKEVAFWAAGWLAGARPARTGEVDEVAWLPVRAARRRLTRESDVALLDALVGLAAQRALATRPLVVVRHATARPRQAWTHADADRPLVAAGRRQALALASLLQCWAPEHLVSSPWLRCTETLAPYAAASGVRVRTKGGLSEAGFARDPRKASRHTQRLLEREQAAALCTHRPVLPAVVAALAESCPDGDGALGGGAAGPSAGLPAAEPYLEPAEALVAHVGRGAGGRPAVLAVERHAPHR
jgi:8-oxo-dGTP diphosphatase